MRPPALIACLPVVLAVACTDGPLERGLRDAEGTAPTDTGTEHVDTGTEPTEASSEPPIEAGSSQLPFDSGDKEVDSALAVDAGPPPWPLGMNDVTILAPLPLDGSPVLPVLLRGEQPADDGQALVPRALFDLLMKDGSCGRLDDAGACLPDQFPPLPANHYAALHLTALRFDLCDRKLPGRCDPAADGSLRVTFQPTLAPDRKDFPDKALHAIYAIPNVQLADVVTELRRLARIQAEPLGSPLKVSPGLADPGKLAYRDGLRALVRKYGRPERLIRLALNHGFDSAYGRWLMRAIERAPDGTFQVRAIPGSGATSQQIHNRFSNGFEVDPPNDAPRGLDAVLRAFQGNPQQTQLLELLRAIEEPNKHGSDDMSCVSCHVATELLERHTQYLGIDAGSVAGAYDGGAYNLSLETSRRKTTLGTLLQLGYWLDLPVISQRVVNETAQTLSEIEARFR